MLCPSECAFPFIAHYVNENKIKNKDTVTGEIKQETKAINLPRNPACPPVALQLWLVLFLTNRYKDWGKSVTWTLREYSSQKGQKKKKKKAVTNKMMGSEPRPLFSVYFHQTSTNAGFNWWHYKTLPGEEQGNIRPQACPVSGKHAGAETGCKNQ